MPTRDGRSGNRRKRWHTEEEHVPEDIPDEGGFADEPVSDVLAALVAELPPMERACVLLKDVLDYHRRSGGVHVGRSQGRPASGSSQATRVARRAPASGARSGAAKAARRLRRMLQSAG